MVEIKVEDDERNRLIRLDVAVAALILMNKRIIYAETPSAVGGYVRDWIGKIKNAATIAYQAYTIATHQDYKLRLFLDAVEIRIEEVAFEEMRKRMQEEAIRAVHFVRELLLHNHGKKDLNLRAHRLVWSRKPPKKKRK